MAAGPLCASCFGRGSRLQPAAIALHEKAPRMCFIARSVRFPVEVEADVVED